MLRIVKVGGSLLTRPDLTTSLPKWLAAQSPAQNWLIVGGGKSIDAIRDLDQLRPGDPQQVHWRCVDLLQVTFEIFAEWFPQWDKIDIPGQLLSERPAADASNESTAIVSVRSFYHRECLWQLPLDWDTTTDSIAAALAIQTGAEETVLLKSCDVPRSADVESLAEQGIVDRALPELTSQLKSIRVERLPSEG